MKSADGKLKSNNEMSANAGHRQRVRERFVLNGFGGMYPHEVLEALLILLIPRKDVKMLAKNLLAAFHTVSEVLAQPLEILENFPGLGHNSAIGLKMFGAVGEFCLGEKCFRAGQVMNTPELIINFVRMKMGLMRHECYMLIFLNSEKHFVEYRVIAEGTNDCVFAYVRNIVEVMVMSRECRSVILVHNHPSGICMPSQHDIDATKRIKSALESAGVDMLDHLIVTHDDYFSFASHNMLGFQKNMEMKNE